MSVLVGGSVGGIGEEADCDDVFVYYDPVFY